MHARDDSQPDDPAPWARGALVSLWLAVFVLAGGALALRWDAIIARLSGPPPAPAAQEVSR